MIGSSELPWLRLPGIYPPQADTEMLCDALAQEDRIHGGTVLDLCSGTGALAVAAARAGAAHVTAVDRSRRATMNVRLNAALRDVAVQVLAGDLLAPVTGRSFDVVLCNPPYVPCRSDRLPRHRRGRSWDAGNDGRSVIDRICQEVGTVLAPGGVLLLVQSAVADAELTVEQLASTGLTAAVHDRREIPFGPVMRSRAAWLAEQGFTAPGASTEEVVVVRAAAPSESAALVGAADVDGTSTEVAA